MAKAAPLKALALGCLGAGVYKTCPSQSSTKASLLAALSVIIAVSWKHLRPYLIFAWMCFFRPIGKKGGDQQQRLDSFYAGQADVYDATRHRLLRGRHTLLRLCAAHLRQMKKENPTKPLVWVDIGGGTGFNIEEMDKYFPIKDFDSVYLIDLCQPLLDVARRRFVARGWNHVQVLCQDATFFSLPEWDSNLVTARGAVSLFTLSYSLSMIPSYFALLDRIDELLDPAGLLGVADFYTSSRASTPLERAIGNGNERRTGFWSRWFWQIWFDLDHVSLSSARREYLEYRFGTSYNGRNHMVPWLVQIPYYVFVGCSRSRSTARAFKAFEIEAGNTAGSGHITPLHSPPMGPNSPTPSFSSAASTILDMPELELGPAVLNSKASADKLAFPLSSFHYQARFWRLPFLEQKEHSEFRSWIYGFTWEDPEVDMKHLNISRDDSLFVITSAGDNALHYAISARPRRIHCVDMNPCQGHLLELKLAAASALTYEEFWAMFGEGRLANFEDVLDLKLSPFLSSVAYQFWRANTSAFRTGFHMRGYSGHALRVAKYAFALGGVRRWVARMAAAETVAEQGRIWDEHLRPVLLAPWIARLFLANPVFLWNALGVPINQMNCFLKEGVSAMEYAAETLDPIAHETHMRTGAYHYLLCLLGRYTRESCPLFLKPEGFAQLQENNCALLDAFRLHTDSIMNALQGLADGSITKMVVMDHMDWFDPNVATHCPLDAEIAQMHRALAKGGAVYWRSAAREPWYIRNFVDKGFLVEALGIRRPGEGPIDRVNMYASFYRAVKA
ncbi:related to Betaine lipid synthase [Phanerochaete sordida]|uniref:Related to Betaine lipid synthase n=1 Tax=Phanerochaete sordida TaxID=48140 RepID=A0A9P3GT14_9APHY|nr:related to Betaine lipid synthase [Phanerochaete sordida]